MRLCCLLYGRAVPDLPLTRPRLGHSVSQREICARVFMLGSTVVHNWDRSKQRAAEPRAFQSSRVVGYLTE